MEKPPPSNRPCNTLVTTDIAGRMMPPNTRAARVWTTATWTTPTWTPVARKGVLATVAGKSVVVVSPGYLTEKGIEPPKDAVGSTAETVIFVLIDNQLAGYVALADRIRDDSKEAVQRLQQAGIKVYMATGDNQQVANAVAKELGLDGVFAQVLPDQKVTIVKDLQAKGQFVAMT